MTKGKFSMGKKKVDFIIKIFAFIVAFLIILEGSSLLFFSPKNATGFKNKLQDAYSFVDEPLNTIQIIGVGNSDLYSGFSPYDLWNEYGYTSTICASAQQSIKDSKYLLERAFESQSPKIVIIETDMIYDSNPDKKNEINKTKNLSDRLEKCNPKYFEKDIENIFTIFKFHNKWKANINEARGTYSTHGYRYNSKTVKLNKINYMHETDEKEDISFSNERQMSNLIDYCKQKGADVILVEMPSISSWNYQRHNAVNEYANSKKVPFLDLNLLYDEIGISMENCFRDEGNHLNYRGTKNATRFIGKYIAENYDLKSLSSNKSYQAWNEDYKRFERSTSS